MNTQTSPELLTASEAMHLLRVSRTWLYEASRHPKKDGSPPSGWAAKADLFASSGPTCSSTSSEPALNGGPADRRRRRYGERGRERRARTPHYRSPENAADRGHQARLAASLSPPTTTTDTGRMPVSASTVLHSFSVAYVPHTYLRRRDTLNAVIASLIGRGQ